MEKKIKKINIRISLVDYQYLKKEYLWNKGFYKNKHKSFSDYIRYLINIGLYEYY